MKVLVILIMLAALYLLYRIACPKRQGTKKEGGNPPKHPIDISEVVVKSRFVLPDRSNSAQHADRKQESDTQQEKPDIFAPETEKKAVAIPPDRLDEAFSSEPNPDELDIEPDENETVATNETETEVDSEEEAEELRQTLGGDAVPADGLSVEEMEAAVAALRNPTEEQAAILLGVEKTDMFEQLVSGDTGRAERITNIINRHVQKLYPEEANEKGGNSDLEHFDVAEFLS